MRTCAVLVVACVAYRGSASPSPGERALAEFDGQPRLGHRVGRFMTSKSVGPLLPRGCHTKRISENEPTPKTTTALRNHV